MSKFWAKYGAAILFEISLVVIVISIIVYDFRTGNFDYR